MSKTIKKDIFAPLSKGLGATRRAAMLLLVMMLTTATAWAGTVDVTVNVTGSGSVSIGNQTATAGNPFTTSVDDGASVTLTFAPDAGNIVTVAKLSYKFDEHGTAVKDIAISGSTATFQMPNDIWNGTGVTINVTFGDGLIGGADEASAVALTDATVCNLAGGYYKVESDISFDHTLNLIGDTYLVIASGAKMTVSSSENGINGESYALNVLGEGTLNVTTTGSYKIAVYVSSYTQLGCSVNLTTTYYGMRCSDSFNISGGSFKTNGSKGIYPGNAVNISGGKLEASNIDANINLSYSNTDDYIKVDNYTSGKTMTIANGQTFTDGTTNYSGTITNLSPLNGKKLFPFVYIHLTLRDATCTEVGIKQECWQRSSDGKYFSDENGTNELNASAVEIPMIAHNGIPHEATDTHIEYWQCSVCGKYFSNSGCTTEITEEDTKFYRTITIDNGISGLVTSNVDKAVAGTTVTLTVSHLIDTSTLQVNSGSVALTDAGNGTYTFTVPAADVTVTASTATTYSVNLPANMEIVSATNTADGSGKYISGTVVTFKASFSYTASNVYDGANTLTADDSGNYSVTVGTADITVTATIEHSSNIDLSQAPSDFTVVDGDVLTGSTSHTVTIANGASITLNDATITGGIVCETSAEITLVGTNSVTGASQKAGIQVGGSGTTLTIKGNGSLTANGGSQSAGIGLSRAWDVDAMGGDIVIEGGTITATGNGKGAGIGTGLSYGNGTDNTATIGNITIKGGTVRAISGTNNDYPGNGIGKGGAYNSGHAVVGTITIYDGIDMVDASSISESIVYMHGESEVTANKTEYFTIIENGNRRVIAPKDDTDYTITIADDIEHGSIACAATTAKFGDNVTITATPALGYRFSRLVVKDAQNNDVESTGNSFFMPKSNVTVSAVFEQGIHGTTEFAWGLTDDFYNPFTLEATIYDGVTTVNLQQGKEYCIGKDYYEPEPGMGSCDNTFRLDEDPNAGGRDIPYSGGTGIFQDADVTKFSLGNEATAGYYDITMTDVGNGKWNVSILKTAGQMDVVPDQTYTGSAITPEPTVIAGSLSLTKGTDYEYSYTNNTNVGTAKVTVTFKGDYASLGSVEKEFTIVKATPTVNAPTAVADLVYNGSAQALVNAGSTDFGTLLYSLDGETYSEDIPTATSAGTHTIYYKVAGDNNHNDVFGSLDVTIAPKAVTNEDITVTIPSQTWTGNELTPVITVKDGETVLTLDEDYTVTAPSGPVEDFGNHAYTITGRGNYAGSREAMFTITPYLAITADGQTISDATTWKNGLVSITGNSTVTFSERITISGTVTLNLGDGTTLIAPKGIEVDKGNTLTIEGNGALNATADKFYAAIGRGFHDSTSGTSGTININGGTVTAIGGRFAAAIGGGYEGVSGTINISGGTIDATGGYCAAGIGGGTFAACGVVNISGGQVTANGDRASGIGPGFDAGTSGTVTLGWTNESDGILASNYNDVETLRIADGKAFTASTGNVYIGTLDDDQRAEIAGKTLKPVVCTGVTLTKESQGLTAIIDGTSTETINIPKAITVDDVKYNRTFTVGKASTVMLPFNYICTGNEGGTFYEFVGIEEDGGKWVATMQGTGDDANNAGTLTANTPYLFLSTETGITFTIPNTGVSLCTAGDGNCQMADAGGNWTFKGTYSYIKWTTDTGDDGYSEEHAAEIGTAYGFAGVEKTGIEVGDFVKVASGAKVRPTSCYLKWTGDEANDSDTNAAKASGMSGTASVMNELPQTITVKLIDANGETTGIGEIDIKTGEVSFDSEAWYTIDGIRLDGKPAKSGMYINNGKKVVVE